MPATAQAHVGMTWLLGLCERMRWLLSYWGTAAIDARRRTNQRWHDMAAGAMREDDMAA